MKKFTKISLIAAAGLFIAGCLLGSISVFAGGGVVVRNNDTWAERTIERIGNALYRATDGRLWHAVSERAEPQGSCGGGGAYRLPGFAVACHHAGQHPFLPLGQHHFSHLFLGG